MNPKIFVKRCCEATLHANPRSLTRTIGLLAAFGSFGGLR